MALPEDVQAVGEAVMAHRLFCHRLGLPPLIHHEDGFNADEAHAQKRARIAWRRLALPTPHPHCPSTRR